MAWEHKYRPNSFSAVYGQLPAVRLLQGLVTRGTLGRHLLLHGAVGSGKTSLVHLFAMALNCGNRGTDGSPCGQCESCKSPSKHLRTYDTPVCSGELKSIQHWVEDSEEGLKSSRVRVLFFDEAHHLSYPAQDSMLRKMESGPENLKFCFATTEVKALLPALQSRCFDLLIGPLSVAERLALLKSLAVEEGVSHDDEALHLLIALRPPYARDLTIALEELHQLGNHISAALVEEFYGGSDRYQLARYCLAVANGDLAEQGLAYSAWSSPVPKKIGLIGSFLVETFYNDVLGQPLVVDALTHSLVRERREFAETLKSRFKPTRPGCFEKAFADLIAGWSAHLSTDQADCHLKLAAFESQVRGVFQNDSQPEARRPPQNVLIAADNFAVLQLTTTHWRDGFFLPAKVQPGDLIRVLCNRVSLYAQHHGRFPNVLITLEFDADPAHAEQHALEGSQKFCEFLADREVSDGSRFAAVVQLEREGTHVVCRVLAAVNQPEADSTGPRALICNSVSMWAAQNGAYLQIRSASDGQSAAVFSAEAVGELCAGLAGYADIGKRSLRRVLKVQVRTPGQMSCDRLKFYGALDDRGIEDACLYALSPLSAFDAEAFSWMSKGWEIREHADRAKELAARRRVVAELCAMFAGDAKSREKELNGLLERWTAEPSERRTRKWRGWW